MNLSVTSIYPYFLASGLLLFVGWVISLRSGFYQQLLALEVASSRFHAIDGLRGFLALGVFFHHAVISHFYYMHGRWEVPPSSFYTLLGQVGVALFFMITAFLFWTKGLKARPYLSVQPMLWSRLCRIAPLYFFSIACVFAVAAVLTDFEMRQTAKTLIRQAVAYLSFGFVEPKELNGLQEAWLINGGVQWSLAYEWVFYLFLPFGLIFARGWGFFLLAVAAAILIDNVSPKPVEWNFLFGAFAALVVANSNVLSTQTWNSKPAALLAIGALVILFTTFDSGYGFWQAVLLFCVFLCIANGNDLFGILSSRAARFLGAISYSIYLMHMIVLFVTLRLIDKFEPISAMSAEKYWIVVAICGVIVVGVCSITYRLAEHPFIRVQMPHWLGSSAPTELARKQPPVGSLEASAVESSA